MKELNFGFHFSFVVFHQNILWLIHSTEVEMKFGLHKLGRKKCEDHISYKNCHGGRQWKKEAMISGLKILWLSW